MQVLLERIIALSVLANIHFCGIHSVLLSPFLVLAPDILILLQKQATDLGAQTVFLQEIVSRPLMGNCSPSEISLRTVLIFSDMIDILPQAKYN